MQTARNLGLSRFFTSLHRSNVFQSVLPPCKPLSLVPSSGARMGMKLHHGTRALYLEVRSNTSEGSRVSWLSKAVGGVAGAGLGLSMLAIPTVFCEPVSPRPLSSPSGAATFQYPEPTHPPTSSVSYLELTFGTVTGICAGVFVKKGAKAVAFVLGGVFVLLQYLGSLSLVRVDWSRTSARFENLFYTKDAAGRKKAPNVGSFFRWIIDFLTADFQQRASFIAGFALGLRIG